MLGDAELVVVTPAPSFLCEGQTPTRLFAANEEEGSDGQVTAWAVADGGLVPVAAAGSGGRHPCHVVYLPTLGAVVASNYTGGSVAVLPAGPLTEGELHRFSGHGPLAARQEGPHAHQAYPAPVGRSCSSTTSAVTPCGACGPTRRPDGSSRGGGGDASSGQRPAPRRVHRRRRRARDRGRTGRPVARRTVGRRHGHRRPRRLVPGV
ncbi:lactonase family protein [Tessaracoccus sp. HDW20]|nr:lactonase family protein [Tessaracoccus coleopterorum]